MSVNPNQLVDRSEIWRKLGEARRLKQGPTAVTPELVKAFALSDCGDGMTHVAPAEADSGLLGESNT